MKKILLFVFATAIFACQSPTENAETTTEAEVAEEASTGSFGEEITADGAITLAELRENMGEDVRMDAKLSGTITECCQKKGCWMTIENPDGDDMRVTFKDYGFFVPKDCSGKEVVMDGFAYLDTIPVDVLRHYAEDAGKSEEEINAITEPSFELAFEAKGVIIK